MIAVVQLPTNHNVFTKISIVVGLYFRQVPSNKWSKLAFWKRLEKLIEML